MVSNSTGILLHATQEHSSILNSYHGYKLNTIPLSLNAYSKMVLNSSHQSKTINSNIITMDFSSMILSWYTKGGGINVSKYTQWKYLPQNIDTHTLSNWQLK